MRSHQRICLVACFALVSVYRTTAFHSLIIPKTSQHRTLTSRHPLLLVPESKEQQSTEEPVPSILLDVPLSDASIPLDDAIPVSSSQETPDLGTTIFLAHTDENVEALLEMEGASTNSASGAGEIQKGDINASDILDLAPQQKRPVKLSLPSDLLDIPSFVSNTGDASVDAVLAASGEAAAAAEAALQSAEADKLEVKDEDTTTINVVLESSTVNEVVKKKEETIIPPGQLIQAPTVSTLLKFAIPAVGVWLCGPLLSLIDTSAVGVLSGTAQQAALNPAVAVTDYAALLIAFLYTGTTNLIAASHAKGDGTDATAETFVGALQLSTWVGAGLGAVLLMFARPAVLSLLGGSGSPTVISAALSYVRIRALGMPAAAMIGSAQAASLGMQDVKSPLYVLGAAAAVNALADLLLVGRMGAAGAAWATVASQYVAAGLFWKWLSTRKVVPLTKAIMEMTTSTTKAPSTPAPRRKASAPSVRGFLHGKLRKREMFRGQRLANTWKQFREYVVPVTSTQVGRVSGYVAMSHVVSSSLGTASMAAQQIVVSLFYCLTPIADALSLTAQSFVPPIADREPSPSRTTALRKTMRNMLRAGAFAGAIMTAAASCIPLVSGTFTQDPAVVQLVNKVVPLLVGVFSMHGLVLAAEGMLMGQKDLGFLGKMYGVFFAVVPLCMLRLKSVASAQLSSVWQVYLGYQSFRFVAWTLRAVQLQRRVERQQQ